MEQLSKVYFTPEERVRLWFLVKDLIKAPEPDGMGAEVGGEEMWELHELLQRVLGRMGIGSGRGVGNSIHSFIETAPESELLDMIELLSYAQALGAQKARSPFRRSSPAEIHRRVNDFLDRIGHPARFDDEGRFVREAFAVERAPALEKLPHKKDLLADLGRLLSTGQQVALVFIDLDNFKAVNDALNHDEGDRCLETVAHIIGSAIAHKGRPYRYAEGDEFMAVLPNFDEAEAVATAERIRKTIDADNPGGSVKVTASIGVVVAAQETHKTAEEALKAADEAMYNAKRTKNSVVVYRTQGT